VRSTNSDFVLSAMYWLLDRKDNITIAPKTASIAPISITTADANIIRLFTMAGIPIVIMACGVVIWYFRRFS
jgi:hypothetical protein